MMKIKILYTLFLLTNAHLSFTAAEKEEELVPVLVPQHVLDQMALKQQYSIPSVSRNTSVVLQGAHHPHRFALGQERARKALERKRQLQAAQQAPKKK